MTAEANRLITESSTSGGLALDCEKQIISLLNTAESYSNMSKYQLSLAHKSLADLYYSLDITGSALEHYKIALCMNPKIAIKKKLKSLESLPKESLTYSLDANNASEPDYSNLIFHKINLDAEFIEQHNKLIEQNAARWGMSVEEYNKMYSDVITKLQQEAAEADTVYDSEWEKEIEVRLSKLDEFSRKEFYRIRAERKSTDGVLSNKKLDLLTLESMEKSYNYRKQK